MASSTLAVMAVMSGDPTDPLLTKKSHVIVPCGELIICDGVIWRLEIRCLKFQLSYTSINY